MSCFTRVLLPACLGFAFCAAVAIAGSVAAEPIQMHPEAKRLPFDHQGPFVTTSEAGVLAVGRSEAYVTDDEGKSWKSYPLFRDNQRYQARDERALLKLRDGTIVVAWMNERERRADGPWGSEGESGAAKWVLPVYVIRSLDDGKTWTEPLKIQDRWCGAIRSLIQLGSGRLVLVGQTIVPWRHVTLTYISDDGGQSWEASNRLDMETTSGGDHSGTMEGTVAELSDGRLLMLIRTTRGWFWRAFSSDGGLTWTGLAQSRIRSSTCCGTLARLASGRLVLLWNRPSDDSPHDISSRQDLSAAFSEDDGTTWSKPVTISRRTLQPGEPYHAARQSYPYLYERRPGELWITTMQGNLRMRIDEADLVDPSNATAFEPQLTIVAFGTSTTARRENVANVYADLLRKELPECEIAARVVNQGVPSNKTDDALKRYDKDVRAFQPDIVIILYGTNDSAVDVWRGATEPRIPLATFRRNLIALVEMVKADGALSILVTPQVMTWTEKLKGLYAGPPHNTTSPYNASDPLGFNATLTTYVQVIREVARDQEVELVDLHQLFIDYAAVEGQELSDLLLDGMHPNGKGHRVIADALLPIVVEHAQRKDGQGRGQKVGE